MRDEAGRRGLRKDEQEAWQRIMHVGGLPNMVSEFNSGREFRENISQERSHDGRSLDFCPD